MIVVPYTGGVDSDVEVEGDDMLSVSVYQVKCQKNWK